MLSIHVYFNNGCELSCTDVIDRRRFWRTVSKWCKRTNREPGYWNCYSHTPMRVLRVEYKRTEKEA